VIHSYAHKPNLSKKPKEMVMLAPIDTASPRLIPLLYTMREINQ